MAVPMDVEQLGMLDGAPEFRAYVPGMQGERAKSLSLGLCAFDPCRDRRRASRRGARHRTEGEERQKAKAKVNTSTTPTPIPIPGADLEWVGRTNLTHRNHRQTTIIQDVQ
jgi:hypothetical protein